MADESKRKSEIAAEIAQLAKNQDEAIRDATFMGSSTEQYASHEKRSKKIASLRQQLSKLNASD